MLLSVVMVGEEECEDEHRLLANYNLMADRNRQPRPVRSVALVRPKGALRCRCSTCGLTSSLPSVERNVIPIVARLLVYILFVQ